MKRFFLVLISVKVFCEPVVFNATMSPTNCTHKIYHPKDEHIPRPFFSDKKLKIKSMKSPFKAMGSGSFLYHPETNELEYAIAYTNLSSPVVMIHLQVGYPGRDGPILATLISQPYDKGSHFSHVRKKPDYNKKIATNKLFGFITGKIKLMQIGDASGKKDPDKEEKMLLQGGCYVTIHTYLNELGELRGQLTPLSSK